MLIVRRINIDQIKHFQLGCKIVSISYKDFMLGSKHALNRHLQSDWRKDPTRCIASSCAKLTYTRPLILVEPLKYSSGIRMNRRTRQQGPEKKATNLVGELRKFLDIEVQPTRIIIRIENSLTLLNVMIISRRVQFTYKTVARSPIKRSSIKTSSMLRRLGAQFLIPISKETLTDRLRIQLKVIRCHQR